VPASAAAIGATTKAMTVNPLGLGVVAPNPITTTTNDRENSAVGHPAKTRKTAASAMHTAARMPAAAAISCER
jgi:hypothetical protein